MKSRHAPLSNICWKRPLSEWIKVNVDVAVLTLDSIIVELWAIHEGLIHAWSCGYRRVELKSDSLEAVQIATSASAVMKENSLVLSINRVADKLAAKGRALKLSIVVFTVVPGDVRDLVDDERAQSKLARDSEGVFPYDPGRDLVAI
ncbi:hypothetical protein V6N11_040159 [Hibiscus sabdariffa]|uniref:RNase H type-1 domain-containing protein n=1 Tax=Hibiscus sabdariffa TaxID=183260 RepID=A0ABR2RGN1_9ROSI